VDNGEAGVPVKALYDYDAAEPDELTFKIGNSQDSFSVPQLYKIILTVFCVQIMWSVEFAIFCFVFLIPDPA
jgi:hypothetical protein